jgi:putative ABC transport system substrate-binding protein
MKNNCVLTALLALCLTFCGCTKNADKGKTAAGVKKVGLIQLVENGAFTDMREGFLDRLGELGYEIDLDYKNASGDIGTLNAICQEMANGGYDIVTTIATPAAQAFVNQESKTPLFFISVTDPVGAGIMTATDKPDKNATGTSNIVPVDKIFEIAAMLTPGIRRFGILYNTGETNAVLTVKKAKAYLDGAGIPYIEATVANSSEVQQAAESLAGRADALYIPIDSMVQSAMPQVAAIAIESKKPVYGSSPVMTASGALAAVSVGDREIGAATAEMAAQYFSGTPLTDIPARVMDNFVTVVNGSTAEAIGVVLPDGADEIIVIGK